MYLIDVNPSDLVDLLRVLEWSGMTDGGVTFCPLCRADEPDHTSDCRLVATIKALAGVGHPKARARKEP